MKLQSVKNLKDINFNSKDTLVIFGEVFTGGYVNGLIKAAKKKDMNIIYSTVGRRDANQNLRKLNEAEQAQQPSPIINIPLEAGFDKQPSSYGPSPVDLCQKINLRHWEHACLNKNLIEDSKKLSIICFQNRTKKWLEQLSHKLPSTGNILIAHTMAGGVPRAKILLPALNRVLKGVGKRFFCSQKFWNSDLGWLCEQNFNEVTAQTYKHLIELSSPLRAKLTKQNRQIFYTAYSYHGTKILINDTYQWQSYSPYLQGFAKKKLENLSQDFFDKKINSCVFNVPEIITQSSVHFPGVEIPLYNILTSLTKSENIKAQPLINHCLKKLIPDSLKIIKNTTTQYFKSEEIKKQCVFSKWPQHSTLPHIEKMIHTSKILNNLHKDVLQNITPFLSEVIFTHCGDLILQQINPTRYPYCWLNHDIIVANINK